MALSLSGPLVPNQAATQYDLAAPALVKAGNSRQPVGAKLLSLVQGLMSPMLLLLLFLPFLLLILSLAS